MNIGFVPYNEQMKPEQENGKTIVYPMEKISDFQKKIGENTQYIIHPEEILAENFVLAFTDQQSVPTPDLKEKVRKILKVTYNPTIINSSYGNKKRMDYHQRI